ncbi:TIM barrel protein [Candidatus Acidulodesulfobacterium sp. H_13]|uniref:TIM barrel protein n=1 Tax=Candidatus Acidulodesulfobacterium sp. H_13 TaxID=3395470 RepID=UPI003AF4B41E
MQWSAKPLDLDDIHSFKCLVRDNLMVVAHLSYLVNLGSTDETIREKSVSAVINEIKWCRLLGIKSLIFHHGSNKSCNPR